MQESLEALMSKDAPTVLIIDYGMGNLHSAAKAVSHVAPSSTVIVSKDPNQLESVDRVILPGVGAMRDCMAALTEGGWVEPLKAIWQKKPLLGICVGMQMLLEYSEENGGTPGLGFFQGTAEHIGKKLNPSDQLKVPHMGWNQVRHIKPHPIWREVEDNARFYFVHSFAVQAAEDQGAQVTHPDVIGSVEYGGQWGAVLARDNVVAVQFHPEKSQTVGLQLLSNFMCWEPQSFASQGK